jgi:hypothetical protein
MNSLFGNWKTSMIGFAAALLSYFAALGPNLPTNGREWGVALFSAVLAALGVVSKDASTGSKAP